jgi:hypothetical protein
MICFLNLLNILSEFGNLNITMKAKCPTTYILFTFTFTYVFVSCNEYKKTDTMKTEYISVTTEVKSDFFMPPPLSPNESAKMLIQWFANQSKLCDSITAKTICVFSLFRTPDKNYAIFLAFTKRPESGSRPFEYISSVGNSFELSETKSLTSDQVLEKVAAEYNTFSQTDRHGAGVFEKAESIHVTFDNYHIIKLHRN